MCVRNFKELSKNYEIYERVNTDNYFYNKKEFKSYGDKKNMNKVHCYNCGSRDHKHSECKVDTKCFKCHRYWYVAKNCIGNNVFTKEVNFLVNKERYKKFNINGQILNCITDTGSDVSIVKMVQ